MSPRSGGATVCVTAPWRARQAAPGVTKTKFVIGGTFPLSGPAAYYAPIPVGMKVYFTYINTRRGADHKRGVSGRQIVWKYYDDGYNPANTAQQTRKLVEEDKVFATFGALGTEPQQAVVDYMNDRKVPQLLVSTGARSSEPGTASGRGRSAGSRTTSPRAGSTASTPRRTGRRRRSRSSTRTTTTARTTSKGSKSGLGAKSTNIVKEVGVTATQASVGAEVVQLKASGADVVAIFATPSPTVKTFATMKALSYKPEQVILNSVSANDYVMGLALANSNAATLDGSISTAYLLNSNDPKYANNAFVKLYKSQMAKWAPSADPRTRSTTTALRRRTTS